MSPQPTIDHFSDLDHAETVLRKIRPIDVHVDPATREMSIIPTAAFVFDDDLSLARESIVKSLGSTIEAEYGFPSNGAVEVVIEPLVAAGASAKETPNEDHPVLGPAHASIYGIVHPRPSKTEKTLLRDLIMSDLRWRSVPDSVGATADSDTPAT